MTTPSDDVSDNPNQYTDYYEEPDVRIDMLSSKYETLRRRVLGHGEEISDQAIDNSTKMLGLALQIEMVRAMQVIGLAMNGLEPLFSRINDRLADISAHADRINTAMRNYD